MSEKQSTQSLTLSHWQNIFKCIGGECQLTCCNAFRWGILIEDEILDVYKNLDDEYGDVVRNAIDFEKKLFKSKHDCYGVEGQKGKECALLTDDGWCNIVLRYGEEYLCPTCRYYPRDILFLNNHVERFVDISCPVVSGYLLDENIPMHKLDYEDVPFIEETSQIDDNIFSCMVKTRDFLMDLFLSVDGYSAGKCFIMLNIANEMQQVFDKEDIDAQSFDSIYNKYESTDTIAAILEECEQVYDDTDTRINMLYIAINMIIEAFPILSQNAEGRLNHLKDHVDMWQQGVGLREDFLEFSEYLYSEYPKFTDRYMAYRAFSNWLKKDYKNFSKVVKLGYMVCLLCKICAMSEWKANGKILSTDEFAYIIAVIERAFFHDSNRIKNVSEEIDKLEKNNNYSIFLMPVY